jgi:hypothetical protein
MLSLTYENYVEQFETLLVKLLMVVVLVYNEEDADNEGRS